MSSSIVLFGIGSPVCADVVESCRRKGLGIAAAIRNVPGSAYVGKGISILEVAQATPEIAKLPFLLPMYGPKNRRTALADAIELGFHGPTQLLDPTAIVAGDCAIEAGVYVNAGCIIGSGSSLERFAFCNRGANIGHHCRIGAFASIGPGAVLCGRVTIGEGALIGAGAVVLPQVRIGAAAVVAPGAVVARDVPDGGLAAGNPARILAKPPASG
jgi:hypothetical protein